MNARIQLFVLVYITTLSNPGLSQPAATNLVHISGRIVDDTGPRSVGVRMARVVGHDLTDEKTVTTGRDGIFVFLGVPGNKYRIDLPTYGVRIQRTVVPASAKDLDLGDLVFERCPDVYFRTPKAPDTPEFRGDLKIGQIVIEPQKLANGQLSIVDAYQVLGAPTNDLNGLAELPPCWLGPSLEKRGEWEALCSITFDRYLSIESFVGGKVKSIRVIRYDPKLTLSQIQDEVFKAWLGAFSNATCSITWAEYTRWNIEASVEFVDGKKSSILMDGWTHVRVQDHEGRYWYIRLWPAA
jgi:hypothetical protein